MANVLRRQFIPTLRWVLSTVDYQRGWARRNRSPATARKIVVLFYNTLRQGMSYVDPGATYYEDRYQQRVLSNLQRRARSLEFSLHKVEADRPGRCSFGNWPATVATIARRRGLDPDDIEVWFADEARVGQKNRITRRWARRGSRPSAPSDQRTASTYIFGAICRRAGKAVGLILPWRNTAMMNLHLAAIFADVAPGRHALLLADQAGWHLSHKLVVPDNITIVPLPPKCPELNLQENVWQFIRDNWLSNRVFDDIHALIDHCSHAWNKLDSLRRQLIFRIACRMPGHANTNSPTITHAIPQPFERRSDKTVGCCRRRKEGRVGTLPDQTAPRQGATRDAKGVQRRPRSPDLGTCDSACGFCHVSRRLQRVVQLETLDYAICMMPIAMRARWRKCRRRRVAGTYWL